MPGVAAVHDLHVWTVTSGMVAMSGHAVVPDLATHPGVLAGIREAMGGLGIGHVTIQLETGAGVRMGRERQKGRRSGPAGRRMGGRWETGKRGATLALPWLRLAPNRAVEAPEDAGRSSSRLFEVKPLLAGRCRIPRKRRRYPSSARLPS